MAKKRMRAKDFWELYDLNERLVKLKSEFSEELRTLSKTLGFYVDQVVNAVTGLVIVEDDSGKQVRLRHKELQALGEKYEKQLKTVALSLEKTLVKLSKRYNTFPDAINQRTGEIIEDYEIQEPIDIEEPAEK